MNNIMVKGDFEISFDEDAGTVDIIKTSPTSGYLSQYSWEVERFTTSAGVLDYIVQISNKPWATYELVGALVKLLQKLLYLQGNYCGQGKDAGFKDSEDVHSIIIEERVRREYNEELPPKPKPKDVTLPLLDLSDLLGGADVIEERVATAKLESKWISTAPGDTR